MRRNRGITPGGPFQHPLIQQQGEQTRVFEATANRGKDEASQIRAAKNDKAPPVKTIATEFPDHLFIPKGATSLDLRRLVSLAAGSVRDVLFQFTAPQNAGFWIIGYAVFNDALDASLVEFIPQVNGNRVWPYHGDPMDNFKISLGLAPDLGNEAIISSQLYIEPNQTFRWLITNLALVDVAMGARIVGYLDFGHDRKTQKFGG